MQNVRYAKDRDPQLRHVQSPGRRDTRGALQLGQCVCVSGTTTVHVVHSQGADAGVRRLGGGGASLRRSGKLLCSHRAEGSNQVSALVLRYHPRTPRSATLLITTLERPKESQFANDEVHSSVILSLLILVTNR